MTGSHTGLPDGWHFIDEIDPEAAMRTIAKFMEACTSGQLNLNAGALKLKFLRQCLMGNGLLHLLAVVAEHGTGRGDNNFLVSIAALYPKCMTVTAYLDEKAHVATAGNLLTFS
jgi:hypothetical protein